MAAETLVALAVVAVLAFVAGWIARGRADASIPVEPDVPVYGEPVVPPSKTLFAEGGQSPSVSPGNIRGQSPSVSPGEISAPDPAAATVRLLDRAFAAYEAAVERWLDEGADITPAGRAALGELDRAIKRADIAAARIAEGTEPRFSALDALDALREAARLLQPYREGATLDANRSRDLDRLEDEIRRAREGVAT